MIKLDILSDPICPWCYIGWTHLARALEQRPDHPLSVEWHPFQLNPDHRCRLVARVSVQCLVFYIAVQPDVVLSFKVDIDTSSADQRGRLRVGKRLAADEGVKPT